MADDRVREPVKGYKICPERRDRKVAVPSEFGITTLLGTGILGTPTQKNATSLPSLSHLFRFHTHVLFRRENPSLV